MEIKINTKEKFTVLTPITPHLTDTLALQLNQQCQNVLQNNEVKNLILNVQSITNIDVEAAKAIVETQHKFYEHNVSFVICELKPQLEEIFENLELLELMNVTPTESEAWDIVQMEEIERELFNEEME